MIFLRTAFNYDIGEVSEMTALYCPDTPEDNRTKQSFKDECDINVIVDRFMKTGEMPKDLRQPVYGDYDGVIDFQSAMNAVVQAEETFMAMPASVRARFDNDPQKFLDFADNDGNAEEMVKMGLAVKRENASVIDPGRSAGVSGAAGNAPSAPGVSPAGLAGGGSGLAADPVRS